MSLESPDYESQDKPKEPSRNSYDEFTDNETRYLSSIGANEKMWAIVKNGGRVKYRMPDGRFVEGQVYGYVDGSHFVDVQYPRSNPFQKSGIPIMQMKLVKVRDLLAWQEEAASLLF
jgi:hypothetical protein